MESQIEEIKNLTNEIHGFYVGLKCEIKTLKKTSKIENVTVNPKHGNLTFKVLGNWYKESDILINFNL